MMVCSLHLGEGCFTSLQQGMTAGQPGTTVGLALSLPVLKLDCCHHCSVAVSAAFDPDFRTTLQDPRLQQILLRIDSAPSRELVSSTDANLTHACERL
jgi:hypothetical protein